MIGQKQAQGRQQQQQPAIDPPRPPGSGSGFLPAGLSIDRQHGGLGSEGQSQLRYMV
jgi:hypothetical protein